MNNLTKTAKTLDKICRLVQIVFFALAIAAGICLAIVLVDVVFKLDPSICYTDFTSLDIGIMEIELTEKAVVNHNLAMLQSSIILALSCVCLLIGRQGILCIRNILKPMTEGLPFDSAVSANLKKLSNLTIIAGIAINLTTITEGVMTVFAYNLPDLINVDLVSHVTLNYSLDLTFLLFFGILRLLSYVFSYGEELQKLSDETV